MLASPELPVCEQNMGRSHKGWGPYNKDYSCSILGSILGSPSFWKITVPHIMNNANLGNSICVSSCNSLHLARVQAQG